MINYSEASSEDVVRLANQVRSAVKENFGITLEHEVRFMGKDGEINLDIALEALA